jgi:predicted PurR-regulated permease PerM
MLTAQPGPRDRRLLSALLILGVVAVFFFIVEKLSQVFFYFGDILLTFFLAWLLAFIISPIVTRIVDLIPRLPRAAATVLVYSAVVLVLILVVVVAAGALATSIAQFAASIPNIKANLPTILGPWQQWLDSIGLNQINLVLQAEAALGNLDAIAAALVAPLQQIAVASLSVVGTLLIVFFLSIYMVLDRDAVLAFLFRIVPPSYSEEARLLEVSVSRSFGGFLRGQALMGVVYFLVALGTNVALDLPLAALTSVLAGLLQMIPFFGPFVSWAPPVIVALVLQPESLVPSIILMGAGWIVVMNVLQPRIMQGAVGIHPIVVLGSVLIGGRIAGIPGAIFGIPIAAVVSAFALEFLHRTSGDRTVAGRAARRLEKRDGKPVRIPREPAPGSAADIDEPGRAAGPGGDADDDGATEPKPDPDDDPSADLATAPT